jgi:hypothetical protein
MYLRNRAIIPASWAKGYAGDCRLILLALHFWIN